MRKYAGLLIMAVMLLVIGGCAAAGLEIDTSSHATAETNTTYITLTGSTATADGEGVTVDGNTITITDEGTYVVTGTLTDGQIVIDAGKKDDVELVLSDASISSSTTAAVYAVKADKLTVTLAEGTDNILSDASAYTYPDAQTDEPTAALYAKCDLTLDGDGTLMVYGNSQNGIVSKDDLKIRSGAITVQAQNNGIRGKDSVEIKGGVITINAGNDGIQSDNTGDEDSGTVLIKGGVVNIVSAHDGIQAQTELTLEGGEISVMAGGGYTTESYSADESYKALKSAGNITITGGTMTANSLDDAIHAAGTVAIEGGVLSLMSHDDGIHADGTVNIKDGTVDIQTSYEGIEGAVVNISGGTVSLLAADDGINAADTASGGQGDSMGGFGGTGDTSLQVNFSGGTVYVNAYGDGIDSNGIITMTGGELYVSGPITSQNGALDYDNAFQISGGVLAAAGAAGMAQTPDSSSSQPSVIVYFPQSEAAGSTYLLTDESGNILLSYAPEKEFQCIVFSVPQLKSGSNYQVYESADGTLTGATLLYDFTISDTVTAVGDTAQNTWNTQQNFGPQQNNRRRP